MTLAQQQLNRPGEILGVDGNTPVSQRLMAMGFLPGAAVSVVQAAPFGDPITVDLSGWRVSLRMSEARLIRTRAAS